MDCTIRDGPVLRLQEELSKLKGIFQSSADSQNWAKSENVCRCTDDEFNVLLESLSPNPQPSHPAENGNTELEAGTLILQRHIDLERQISKCLENLKGVRSGDDKKNIDVSEKLVASQCKVARLRSRLIRCITQQLQKKCSFTNRLLPWSGVKVDGSGSFDEGQPMACLKLDKASEQTLSLTDPGDKSKETAEDENVSLYETKYPLATVSGIKGQMSTAESGGKPLFEAVQREIKDGNAALEEKQNKCQVPPKPAPYSSLKKTNPAGSDSVGEMLMEKVKVPRDVPYEDEPDAIVTEQHYLQNWDPTPVLKELFGNVRLLSPPCEHSTQEESNSVRMAGYMEKLPVKNYHKKASVFKSWKKRHFKAVNGKLFYYEDHRSEQPLGFIDLVGCSMFQLQRKNSKSGSETRTIQVACIEDKMLEVVEQSGRSLKLKCTSVKEAEDWKEALQAEAVCLLKALSKDKSCGTEGLTIIIDLGSSTVKAGFAQEDAWPQVMFPCVIAVDKQNTDNCKFGFDALLPETRKTSTLIFPLRKSLKIDKLKFDTVDLIGILEHVFKQLQVDPSKHKVIMTLPYGAGPQEKEELVELLLDQFQVEACYLQEQAILSMYSYSAISGIVVDIGNHIDIFAVVEGCMIESGTTRLPYGGRQITDSFTRLLTEKGLRLFSEVESYVSQAVKEKVSFVAKYSPQDEEETSVESAVVVNLDKYSLPDGTRSVTVDTERHRCTEGLFKPSVWGKDNPGIHELTVKAIMASGIDMRKQMCRNVYLTGGGSMSAGLAERLQAEVSALMPSSAHVQVHAGLERHHAAYIGASVVAKLPLFEQLCVSKEEWDQLGPGALQKWSTV